MKRAIACALFFFAASAIAQQAPGAVTKSLPEPRVPAPPRPPPTAAPAAAAPAAAAKAAPAAAPIALTGNSDDIAGLLRAQTNAIKALSRKLESLEERIGKVEQGRR